MVNKNEDGKKGGSGGAGPVLLLLCVLVIVSFLGDGHPLDRMADIIMILTWCIAIGFFICVLLFTFAYYFQTAITDFYDSILEDMEQSQFRDKLVAFKALLDKHVFNYLNKDIEKTENIEGGASETRKTGLNDVLGKAKNFIDKSIPERGEAKSDNDMSDYDSYEEDILRQIEEEQKRNDR